MYPKGQTRPKGPLWGPEGVMRGGRARGKAKKNDFILKKLKENAFIQNNFFSPFLLLALKRCEQPSCQVQPGPRYRRTARTRRSGRGTRDADIAPRNVGGTTPSRPSRFLMPPRLSSSSGGVLSRRLAEFPGLGSSKTN